MSFRFKNTEAYLTNYTKKLIVLTRQEILSPQQRTYTSLLYGTRTINSPINSTGSLRNSLRLEKKLKDTVNEKGFKATQSYRIVGNAYGELLDEGATPQQAKATVSKLERWISNKPVTLDKIKNKSKVAGLIKRKIDRYGIQGTGFLQKIVDKQFNNVLGVLPSLVKDIELNLEDMFVTLGWDKKGQNTFVRKT
jgi:hypothetical protein